ncbi:hypothetical protein ACFO3J_03480 [Streptomyces polygonati]|uniref:Uncharacterized protein n=1 Tax=Streptomyces polygonati TaxID=1617087 RepID=A0ABV8HFC3_9ACTN
MTTQSPHLYTRRGRPAAPGPAPDKAAGVQTRLPWWAVALPAVAFAALLALLSAGPANASAGASAAAVPTASVLARFAADLADLVHQLL